LGVIGLCESGAVELVSSDVLLFEVKQNPKMIRRDFGLEILAKADEFVFLNDQIEERAKEFTYLGIKPLDALHLASAEIGHVDAFCTCDDLLLKKAKDLHGLNVKIVSPIELIEEIEQWPQPLNH
jgi:hypothetical protein